MQTPETGHAFLTALEQPIKTYKTHPSQKNIINILIIAIANKHHCLDIGIIKTILVLRVVIIK